MRRGHKKINGKTLHVIDGIPTAIEHIDGDVAKGYALNCNAYLTPCYVIKWHGRFAHGATLREARAALEEKVFKGSDMSAKITMLAERLAVGEKHPAQVYYGWYHRLTRSGILAHDHSIQICNDMWTVTEFVSLIEDDNAKKIFTQLAEAIELYRKENDI